jgi:aspartate aminotransferase
MTMMSDARADVKKSGESAGQMFLAPRIRRAKPSPTAAISDKIRTLREAGRSVINLGEGELDFDTPPHVKEAGVKAIRDGDTKYTAVAGTQALKQAIVEKFFNENALSFLPNEIIVGAGAKQIIFNAFLATVSRDDEVILPAPHWVSYPEMVRLADGTPRIIACEENAGWKLRPDALAAAITPRTRWLVLNSPSNPTGAIYSRQELALLAEVLLSHEHVLVMVDDIYEHIRYSGNFSTIAAIDPRLRDRTLTVNGVSKAYSMTGWRIGYAGGPLWLISAIDMLHSQSTSNPSSISQAAAVRALQGGTWFMADWLSELRMRRDLAAKAVNSAKGLRTGIPDGAFYLFVNCTGTIDRKTPDGRTIKDDVDFADYLLDSVGVGTVHGSAFGTPGYIRIAYAVDREVLKDACARIVKACDALR